MIQPFTVMIPRLLWPLLTPVRSAPSCGGGYPSRDGPHRSPRVPHVSFPPSTRHIYSTHFRVVIGLRLVQQSCPCVKPQMCFLYVGPEVCPRVSIFPESSFLQIPPHGGHPCFRLYPSHYRADSGLSPVRNVRRRAHCKKTPAPKCRSLFYCSESETSALITSRCTAGLQDVLLS